MHVHHAQRTVLAFAAAAVTAGCSTAPPEPDREAWLSMTSHTVPADKESALKAAEKVLRLADEKDTKFTHAPNGFMAVRQATTWLVFAFVDDFWQWQVTASPAQGGTKLTAMAFRATASTTVAPVGPYAIPMSSGTGPTGRPVYDQKLYTLLWERVDHLISGSPAWRTCEDAGIPKASPEAEATPLCGIGREDSKP